MVVGGGVVVGVGVGCSRGVFVVVSVHVVCFGGACGIFFKKQALTWLNLYVLYIVVHGCLPVSVIFCVAWYLLV